MGNSSPIRASIAISLLLTALVMALLGCGNEESTWIGPPPFTPADASADTTLDSPSTVTLRIEPAVIETSLPIAGPSPTVTFRVLERAAADAAEVDVTASASVSLSDSTIGSASPGAIRNLLHGGQATLTALVHGASASATLRVTLTGDLFTAGFDPNRKNAFDTATVDPSTASAPTIEYPLQGAVVPLNVPPMEVQWTVGGDSTAYRLRLTAPYVSVVVYVAGREVVLPNDTWRRVVQSARAQGLQSVVEGLGQGKLHVSTPVSVAVASDSIDDSAVYYWESSSGSMKVLDIATGGVQPLPVKGSQYAPGSPTVCVACHTVSRDGTRFAYDTGTFSLGTLKLSADKQIYEATIEPGTKVSPGFKWTYGAFNPGEPASPAGLLVSKADSPPTQNAAGHVRLALVDPDTGVDVPSNADPWLAAFPSGMGRDVLQPDWSPAGFIVFAAYDSEQTNPDSSALLQHAYVRDLGDDAVASSIVEAPLQWDAASGAFVFGTPKVLVQAPLGPSLDVTETDVLPQISPDDRFVVFTRSDGWWPIRLQTDAVNGTGRLVMVRRSDGALMELSRASGPKDSNSTWPQWAPTMGSKYAWVAFSSERPYGHRMAPGVTLPGCQPQYRSLCKNMWITAIDLQAAASGTQDPSQVPFWLPGQVALASAVSPRWTKAALAVPK
jgi:hypothetical protein